MRFKIRSTRERRACEIIKKYPCLRKYCYEYIDGQLPSIGVENLYRLIQLKNDLDQELIITKDSTGIYTIEIYDGFREWDGV